jgi:hypothetical protein
LAVAEDFADAGEVKTDLAGDFSEGQAGVPHAPKLSRRSARASSCFSSNWD